MSAHWFNGAALGLFIHWDHASQQGLEISWPMVGRNAEGGDMVPPITVEQYNSSAATFNPSAWNPAGLAALAREAGFRYAVFTAKHHTGYCMFDSKFSDFSVTKASSCGRDLVAEYVEAFRNEGLRVGLYFSLSDWHHPDYPAITPSDLPYVLRETPRYPGDAAWKRYLGFMHSQLAELLTNYGKIDLIWFDGDWERTSEQWRVGEIDALVRSLQPDILVNDRLPDCGDYATPEQIVPGGAAHGEPWEACMTMNDTWAYNPEDVNYKSATLLTRRLIETVAGAGNLLLDVSPNGDGSLPAEQLDRLKVLGAWLSKNGESIFGVEPGLEPWQFYGPTTKVGDTVYLHVLSTPYDVIDVRGVPIQRVKRVLDLATRETLQWRGRRELHSQAYETGEPLGNLEITPSALLAQPEPAVIAIEFEARR